MSLPTHAICIGTYELLLPLSLVHEKHAKRPPVPHVLLLLHLKPEV